MRLFVLTILLFSGLASIAQRAQLDSSWTIKKEEFGLGLIQLNQVNTSWNTQLEIRRNDALILADSIYCSDLRIEFKDINQDNHLDLLVFQNSGARSNVSYHLYLFVPNENNYQKVLGYNDWPNLKTTETKGILAACILTGSVEYKFFELTTQGELVDLNISQIDSSMDDKAYQQGLLQARKKVK